uniref:RiboL-PSP-HEPN domain-containing protein n=1 Tax=Candidatus Kentrum sp. TUN TaxID=2126343 RepID=A0A450ZF68_9GAMM|nr:MAG: hypothetical protein BECKTUN1418F_GA0071002_100844 [Candidatus Kentron sp. TUN]VFK52980.1 MAG: hypothetical protein BECKTUN1418E_GA0071001_101144 [Candidatus Kentron sp. TUN]
MNLESFRAQMEAEIQWRKEEIIFLDNIQRSLEKDEDRKKIRRSILCIIYAHIEGFIKFAFSLYVDEINKEKLTCSDVKPVIAAAAFHKEFNALKNEDKKSEIFKKELPDNSHLHRLSREIEFIERINEYYNYTISIPDEFLNTRSNVGKDVIEKLLFQVGLEYEDLKDICPPLNRLLKARNDIAHGNRKLGIEDKDYDAFMKCLDSVIKSISRRIIKAYEKEEFRLIDKITAASTGSSPPA